MTDLNQLYGPARTLPTSAVKSLSALTGDLASLPDGERLPHVRIWVKPTTDYAVFDGIEMSRIDIEGWTSASYLYFQSSDLEQFPPVLGMTDLRDLYIDFNRISYVPDLSSLTNLTTLDLNNGTITQIESLAGTVKLQDLFLNDNQLASLPPLTTLTQLAKVRVQSNQLEPEYIDQALMDLAANGVNNGQFNYSSNPGAPDDQRSTEGAAAKASLVGRGWTITV